MGSTRSGGTIGVGASDRIRGRLRGGLGTGKVKITASKPAAPAANTTNAAKPGNGKEAAA